MALDLVGGPFAVLESDPGVFTTLLNRLGIRDLEVEEIFSVGDLGSRESHERPRALILCYRVSDTGQSSRMKMPPFPPDPDMCLWFANQLDDDACASITLLNILFNCHDIKLGKRLEDFKTETGTFDAVMRGLAISNSDFLRKTHNSLARPCDIKASMYSLTLDASPKYQGKTSRRGRGSKSSSSSPKRRKITEGPEKTSTYHYIGYVPFNGRVWELDGLRDGPIDLGEYLNQDDDDPSPSPESGPDNIESWLDIVIPVLTTRMAYHSTRMDTEEGIEFNLLAIVDSKYCRASDQLEACIRERKTIEKRFDQLGIGIASWQANISSEVLILADEFLRVSVSAESSQSGKASTSGGGDSGISKIFSSTFASENMNRSIAILADKDPESLTKRWIQCIHTATTARRQLDEELERMRSVAIQNERRCHDYEPFLKAYVTALGKEGLLKELLDVG